MLRFSGVKLPEDGSFICDGGQDLVGLKSINVIVAPNNAGKSRLMRWCIQRHPKDFAYRWGSEESWEELHSLAEVVARKRSTHSDALSQAGLDALADLDWSGPRDDFGLQFHSRLSESFSRIAQLRNSNVHFVGADLKPVELVSSLRELAQKASALIGVSPDMPGFSKRNAVYMPVSRSFLATGRIGLEYEQSIDKNVLSSFSADQNVSVLAGGSVYDDIQGLLLGALAARNQVRSYERWLSEKFFSGVPVSLIPRLNDCLHIKIGGEVERSVAALGEGLQSIIVVTYSAYMQNIIGGAVIGIEEPENLLHPGMKRQLMKALGSLENNLYFLTTHSNHILDFSVDGLEATVIRLDKELPATSGSGLASEELAAVVRIAVESRRDVNPVIGLGVRPSSIFFANVAVWVEGISDRICFQHLLREYGEKLPDGQRLVEGLHYSFAESGGANIAHYSFDVGETEDEDGCPLIDVSKISPAAVVVIDGDSASKGKREGGDRGRRLGAQLKDRLLILPCKELENFFSWHDIKANLPKKVKFKADAQEPAYADYKDKPLLEFLKGYDGCENRHELDSLTLGKKAFAAKLANSVKLDGLPHESKLFVKKMYETICEYAYGSR